MSISLPIILICGNAGSGKDTAANHIAQQYSGMTLGQADPIKRFIHKVFNFNSDQLWGPSELRNARDPRFNDLDLHEMREVLDSLEYRYNKVAPIWLKGVLGTSNSFAATDARTALDIFFKQFLKSVSSHRGISPRETLQVIGTEWGRETVDANLWVNKALQTSQKLLHGRCFYTHSFGLEKDKNQPVPGFVIVPDGRFANEIMHFRASGALTIKIERHEHNTVGKTHRSESELDQIPAHFYNEVVHNDGTIDDLKATLNNIVAKHYDTKVWGT